MKIALSAALGLALAASGVHAQDKAAPDKGGQCFFPREIRNYTVSDDEQTLYLKVGGNHFYRLNLDGACVGLAHRTHILLKAAHGASTICQGIDVDLLTSDRGSHIPCTVHDLHEMTPAEVAALSKADRP